MKYSCFGCGAVYSEKVVFCISCLESNMVIPLPEKERNLFVRPNRKGVMSSRDLKQSVVRGKTIRGFEALGRLPKAFRMMLYGVPGSGKSTVALQIANNYEGESLYFSCEEGFGEDFITKLDQWEIYNVNVSDAATVMEIEADYHKSNPALVVVDSVSVLEDIPTFDCSCVYICHSTKEGRYKGTTDLAHSVQVVVRVDNGYGFVEKNRFAERCDFPIFEGVLDEE